MERFERYLAALRLTCGASGCWNYARRLHAALGVLAPDDDWSWLARQVRLLERACPPRRLPLVDSRAVADLGERLFAGGLADLDRHPGRLAARDGLLLLMLAYIPIRLRNLAMIELGRHLSDGGDAWQLAFEAGETKSGRPLSYKTGEHLTRHLDDYLAEVRPRFPGALHHARLWPSTKGGPLSADRIAMIVSRRTLAGLGRALSPHDLRHAAAGTIAARAPERIGLAADLLGHSDFRTTERHYLAAETRSAGARFAATLALDRDGPDVRRHLRTRPRKCAP